MRRTQRTVPIGSEECDGSAARCACRLKKNKEETEAEEDEEMLENRENVEKIIKRQLGYAWDDLSKQ